ncbi:tetratricopeptide repeat protein [Bermanella sp. R86510]|uniref:tetratricopeptide repeat protein n=1 Tax=unclassified Bermanella TaxID=2627862 RepID=UPI0037C8F315
MSFLLLMYLTSANAQEPEISPEQTRQARLQALEVLINRQQFEQAFTLASKMKETEEGNAQFDFNYGMAAIETGNFDQALFAFERLLFMDPRNPRYRLELARTHFYLRNLTRSEVEFKKVLALNPPLAVQQNVQQFLDEIANLYRRVQPEFYATIDLGGGYDSNINSATSERELPSEELIFPVDIVLNDASRETGSAFWSTLLNFAYVSPISKTQSWDVRALYNKRANSEIPDYDLDTIIAEGGYGFFTGPVKWRTAGRYQTVQLDGEDFVDTLSVLGSANWRQKSGASYGIGFNYGQTSYDISSDNDITQTQFKLTYQTAPKRSSWLFSLIFGDDAADKSINNYNGKSYQGASVQNQTLYSQRSSYYWMASITAGKHDAINSALYTKLRKDTNLSTMFGWRYYFTSSFSFRNDYSYSYQDSTLEANTYSRAKVEVGINYRF